MEKLLIFQVDDPHHPQIAINIDINIHNSKNPQKKLKTRLPKTNEKSSQHHFLRKQKIKIISLQMHIKNPIKSHRQGNLQWQNIKQLTHLNENTKIRRYRC